jgi:hypothetical protein
LLRTHYCRHSRLLSVRGQCLRGADAGRWRSRADPRSD